MGSFDGGEVCERVGMLILVKLGSNYNSQDMKCKDNGGPA